MDEFIEEIEAPFWSLRRGRRKNKRSRGSTEPLISLPHELLAFKRGKLTTEPDVLECPDQCKDICQPQNSTSMKFFYNQLSPSSRDLNGCNSNLPRSQTSHLHKCAQFCSGLPGTSGFLGPGGTSGMPGVSQCRQNSLPSSLASSCLTDLQATQHTTSKSMDSFGNNADFVDRDGTPCLFCGIVHIGGRPPSCRRLTGRRIRSSKPDLRRHSSSLMSVGCGAVDSVSCLHKPRPTSSKMTSSLSHTVLQAEVHHEWGRHSDSGSPERKIKTLEDDSHSDLTDSVTHCKTSISKHQSLPLSPVLPLNDHDVWDSQALTLSPGQKVRVHQHSSSELSAYTDDSGSISDGDSLERDLRSVQNISSFQEFVNSSTFIGCHSATRSAHTRCFVTEPPLALPLRTLQDVSGRSENLWSTGDSSHSRDMIRNSASMCDDAQDIV